MIMQVKHIYNIKQHSRSTHRTVGKDFNRTRQVCRLQKGNRYGFNDISTT